MAERRRGLGRGLGALIPNASEESAPADKESNAATKNAVPADVDQSASKSGASAKKAPSATKVPTGSKARSTAQKSSVSTEKSFTPKTAGKPAKTEKDDIENTSEVTNTKAVSKKTTPPSGSAKSKTTSTRGVVQSKRGDMGAALRKSSGGRRPVDFFFQPSSVEPETEDSASESKNKAGEQDVSRETGVSQTTAQKKTVPSGNKAVEKNSDSSVSAAEEEELLPIPGATFGEVDVEDIHPNRKQPRQEFDEDDMEELVHSIKEIGVLQPIVVRPSREDGKEKYELVMGERRWRATQRAGLSKIPAIIRETQDVDLLRDALLENLHRSQLNPLEEAAAYQQLLHEFGTTQEELARRIGRSRPQISNTIRLLRLPALVQRRVAAGILSSGHARALLALSDPAAIERLAQRIVAEGLSVRAVEEIIQSGTGEIKKKERKATPANRHHERLDYIADAFADKLDTSVKINLGARKGKMTIEFASVEDLNRIISVLDPEIERS